MAEKLIVSISGVRGIVGENLTPFIAAEFGCAFGTFVKSRNTENTDRLSVCIGRDCRPSGEMLKSAVTAGVCAVGADVIDLGVVTTAGVGIMASQLKCAGAVVITASHNPVQYNGMKFLLGSGMAPAGDDLGKIRKYFFDKAFRFCGSAGCGKISSNQQTDRIHIDRVLATIDKGLIRSKRFEVVLDSINGAGGRVGQKMLDELGCRVSTINAEPTGLFAHTPEPLAENLQGLCGVVKEKNADVGFAQDPDADRLAIVDENGIYIGEEYTLALAAKYILSKKNGTIAANLSSSRMVDDIAEKAGARILRTAIGEANVVSAMLENNCILAGEGNGGVIDPRVGLVRDSLVGMAVVLQLMAETGLTISQLVGEIGGYYMKKDKFPADTSEFNRIVSSAKKLFKGACVNTTDGCRFDFDDGWLHLRPSNTEPVIRLIVESKDRRCAEKYIDAVKNIRRQI